MEDKEELEDKEDAQDTEESKDKEDLEVKEEAKNREGRTRTGIARRRGSRLARRKETGARTSMPTGLPDYPFRRGVYGRIPSRWRMVSPGPAGI